MTIAAIVLGMIILFINGVSKSLRKTSDEVNLQLEAQTTMNLISNILMEAQDMDVYPASAVPDPVNGEVRYTLGCGNNEFYTIIFNSTENKLYLVETGSFEEGQTAACSKQEHFMADYVENLLITKNANKTATIDLYLALGKDRYNVKKTIMMRNAE
jgi:hypothetical protein